MPRIADHFVQAKIKHFDFEKKDQARSRGLKRAGERADSLSYVYGALHLVPQAGMGQYVAIAITRTHLRIIAQSNRRRLAEPRLASGRQRPSTEIP